MRAPHPCIEESVDSLHLAIAIVPLAVYLLVLGLINLARRPFLTTGSRDFLALSLGIAGFVIVGPMELFLPERAAQTFGPFVWLLMIVLYFLTCVLLALMGRPRLVIYNTTATELRPVLDRVAKSLDPAAAWADETLILPNVFVQLHVDDFAPLRNVSLSAVGTRQSAQGWRSLESGLADALRQQQGVPNPYGFSLLLFGTVLLGLSTYWVAAERQQVAQSILEMLRL